MKQECTARLPVSEEQILDIEIWLEQMALQGWFFTEPVGKWWYFSKGEPARVRYRLDMITEKDGCLDEKKRECCEAMAFYSQLQKSLPYFQGGGSQCSGASYQSAICCPCFKAIRKNSKRFFHRKVHHSASLRMAAF